MSRIASVSPTTATLASGATVDITVNVADVPADGVADVDFLASDGTAGQVTITIDKPALQALIGGTAALAPHQVRGTVTSGGGTLAVLSTGPASVVFRYTAP